MRGRVAEEPRQHVPPDESRDCQQQGQPELVAEHRHAVASVLAVSLMSGVTRISGVTCVFGVIRVVVGLAVIDHWASARSGIYRLVHGTQLRMLVALLWR